MFYTILDFNFVRLNLFNHVLVSFHTNFSCILASRYLVFRRESCKSCVWESVKKSQEVCNSRESRDWISQLARDWQVVRVAHVWSMQGKLKGHASYSTTGQNFQFGQEVSSRLKLATRSSCEVESPVCPVWWKLTFRILHTPYYKYPYTHKM